LQCNPSISDNVLPLVDVAHTAFPSGKLKDVRHIAKRLLAAGKMTI
jgi:hypothetical protein